MTTFVVAVDTIDTSAALSDYLQGRVGPDDAVHAVNSLPGGNATDAEDVRDGEDALNGVRSRLGAVATVETHQFVRGNDPHEDVLACAADVDADEVVVGAGKRTPTAKVVFGSTTRSVLLHADRPTVVVPAV